MSADAFRAAVAPLIAEMQASANAHDTARHMALYRRDPALVFIFNGEIIRGYDALYEKQLAWWDHGRARGSYAYQGEPMVEALGDDAGLTTVVIAAPKPQDDGIILQRTLVHSALWRRLPEGWRIVWAHESSTR
ncbi:MAG: nuclear transport factor 2 family protein [Burkholderiales bacterium]